MPWTHTGIFKQSVTANGQIHTTNSSESVIEPAQTKTITTELLVGSDTQEENIELQTPGGTRTVAVE